MTAPRPYNDIVAEEAAKKAAPKAPAPPSPGSGFRPVPRETIDLLHPFEGLRLKAYDDKQPNRKVFASVADVKGIPTNGYGHTGPDVTKTHVVQGKTITLKQAEDNLLTDLIDAQRKIDLHVPRRRIDQLTEYQYAALISFVYNAGLMGSWKITALLKAGRFDEVPDQMIRFVNSRGSDGVSIRMQGLVNRRRAEIDLWRSGATAVMPHPGLEYAPSSTVVEAADAKSLATSRTLMASVVSGLSGVGTATTVAIEQVSPHAQGNNALTTVMTICVILSAGAAFAAAMFRAQDASAAKA